MKNTVGIFLLTGLVAAGCGTAPESDIEDAQASLSERTSCSPDTLVTFSSNTRDYPAQAGIAGSTICVERLAVTEAPICGTTGADGKVNLTIRDCEDVRVTYTAPGFAPANQLLRIRGNTTIGTRMLTTGQMTRLAAGVGQPLDNSKAQPIFTAYDAVSHQPIGGLKTTIVPAAGVPWYLSATGVPTASLSEMSAAGISGIMNVPTGTYDVVGTPPAKVKCTVAPFVPGDAPNSVKMEAIAGSIGEAWYVCH